MKRTAVLRGRSPLPLASASPLASVMRRYVNPRSPLASASPTVSSTSPHTPTRVQPHTSARTYTRGAEARGSGEGRGRSQGRDRSQGRGRRPNPGGGGIVYVRRYVRTWGAGKGDDDKLFVFGASNSRGLRCYQSGRYDNALQCPAAPPAGGRSWPRARGLSWCRSRG